jgi:hypothetical protein
MPKHALRIKLGQHDLPSRDPSAGIDLLCRQFRTMPLWQARHREVAEMSSVNPILIGSEAQRILPPDNAEGLAASHHPSEWIFFSLLFSAVSNRSYCSVRLGWRRCQSVAL